MAENQPRTLVDCDCRTHVHGDGSGVEVYFCDVHDAAPALLAACRALVAAADKARSSMVTGIHREIEAVRAAIAKAGG
jgi:hypothetical protein